MKFTCVILSSLLVGCAAQTHSLPLSRLENSNPTHEGELDSKEMIAMQRRGYKLINENGQALFCRSEFKTGSHLEKVTTCMTAQEIRRIRDATRKVIEQIPLNKSLPQG
jgi:hypothetical protein